MKRLHSVIAGLGLLAVAAPALPGVALAQTAPAAPAPAKPVRAPHRAAALPPGLAAHPGMLVASPDSNAPHTLVEALAAAYANDPQLLAERAKLRATDEGVPTALAGWRPTVVLSGSAGYAAGVTREELGGVWSKLQESRTEAAAGVTVTQPLYNGGKTRAATNAAENKVMAERARLISQEQTTLTNVVNAYVGVIQAQETLQLDVSNEQVLGKQLQATNDRFRVGEITRTDVAQAEAALASATATRETAEGNLATARATYQRAVGYLPPGNLVPPQPLALPTKTEQEAVAFASANNPLVVAALFDDAAAKDAVDVAFAALLPQVNLQGTAQSNFNTQQADYQSNAYAVTANLSVPLYQGGSEYAAVRQARQAQQQTRKVVDDARRAAAQSTIQAWETLIAARASVDSTRAAITANRIALDGVEREAIVGSRTTLDVLNAQQALLNSEVTLVQNLASLVNASYGVAQALGRLTARDLALPVPLYDETAYYAAVRNRWAGTGDFATDQPGR